MDSLLLMELKIFPQFWDMLVLRVMTLRNKRFEKYEIHVMDFIIPYCV